MSTSLASATINDLAESSINDIATSAYSTATEPSPGLNPGSDTTVNIGQFKYACKITYTLDSSDVSGPLDIVGYGYLRVFIQDNEHLREHAQLNGFDIFFADSAGVYIPSEMVYYGYGTGEWWLRPDSGAATVPGAVIDQDAPVSAPNGWRYGLVNDRKVYNFYMYYGDRTASDHQEVTVEHVINIWGDHGIVAHNASQQSDINNIPFSPLRTYEYPAYDPMNPTQQSAALEGYEPPAINSLLRTPHSEGRYTTIDYETYKLLRDSPSYFSGYDNVLRYGSVCNISAQSYSYRENGITNSSVISSIPAVLPTSSSSTRMKFDTITFSLITGSSQSANQSAEFELFSFNSTVFSIETGNGSWWLKISGLYTGDNPFPYNSVGLSELMCYTFLVQWGYDNETNQMIVSVEMADYGQNQYDVTFAGLVLQYSFNAPTFQYVDEMHLDPYSVSDTGAPLLEIQTVDTLYVLGDNSTLEMRKSFLRTLGTELFRNESLRTIGTPMALDGSGSSTEDPETPTQSALFWVRGKTYQGLAGGCN